MPRTAAPPQGGIISPILANIYLHELDKHVISLKKEFDTPCSKYAPAYSKAADNVHQIRKQIAAASPEERPALTKQLKAARKEEEPAE